MIPRSIFQALSIWQSDAETWLSISQIARKLGLKQVETVALRSAVVLNPEGSALASLAESFLEIGEVDQALKLATSCIKRNIEVRRMMDIVQGRLLQVARPLHFSQPLASPGGALQKPRGVIDVAFLTYITWKEIFFVLRSLGNPESSMGSHPPASGSQSLPLRVEVNDGTMHFFRATRDSEEAIASITYPDSLTLETCTVSVTLRLSESPAPPARANAAEAEEKGEEASSEPPSIGGEPPQPLESEQSEELGAKRRSRRSKRLAKGTTTKQQPRITGAPLYGIKNLSSLLNHSDPW